MFQSIIQPIADKIFNHQRINTDEALTLYAQAQLGELAIMANYVREKKNGNNAYYNKNFHIEPTNYCIYNCRFCSYSCKKDKDNGWELSLDDIKQSVEKYQHTDVTEVHVVGGVHPDWDIEHYARLIREIKAVMPHLHVKAYSAVEIAHMAQQSGVSYAQALQQLKDAGLNSIPGGGAEIFNPEIRQQICPDKINGDNWLAVHKAAHELKLSTNATMLYGHMENYSHRVEHLSLLRNLQDETNGFNAFIPLKYRKENNSMERFGEVTLLEDLRNFCVSRIFLDNFNHLKAYWPMLGKDIAQLSLSFGVDDLDGTIDDTTKIYSMAGAENKPVMTTDEIQRIIIQAGRTPIERDSLYNAI